VRVPVKFSYTDVATVIVNVVVHGDTATVKKLDLHTYL